MYLPCTFGLMSTASGSMRAILLTLHVNVAPNSSRVICISSKLLPVPAPVSVIVDELVAEMEQFIFLDKHVSRERGKERNNTSYICILKDRARLKQSVFRNMHDKKL